MPSVTTIISCTNLGPALLAPSRTSRICTMILECDGCILTIERWMFLRVFFSTVWLADGWTNSFYLVQADVVVSTEETIVSL